MPGFPTTVSESGRLVDMKDYALTTTAVPVSATSYPTMVVSIQADADNAVDVLIGDASSQSRHLVPGATYNVNAGDANNVYMRAASDTATVNVHLLVPARSR